MTLVTERNTGSCRYGGADYWALKKNLGGTAARRLAELVELHFQEDGSPLVLDLRRVAVVDSEGAHCLESARRRHAGLQVVGRPRDYAILPNEVKKTLDIIRPSETLERALSRGPGSALRKSWPEKRRHHRIPVSIPVEIFCGERSSVTMLRDISLGGVRLGRISPTVSRELEGASSFPRLTIAGMEQDPLGREIARSLQTSEVVTSPVYLLPGNSGLGARFAPPPG